MPVARLCYEIGKVRVRRSSEKMLTFRSILATLMDRPLKRGPKQTIRAMNQEVGSGLLAIELKSRREDTKSSS